MQHGKIGGGKELDKLIHIVTLSFTGVAHSKMYLEFFKLNLTGELSFLLALQNHITVIALKHKSQTQLSS